VPALRSLTDDFAERTGMPANFIATNIPPDLAPPLATAAYRITQEALRNVSKHAGETSVRVRFECCASELVVVISDLGVGFDANHKTGLGLISMRERAHLAGGSFNLTSAIGKGTTIQVRLPLPTPIIIKPRN
jgi:signal transduction histidine kinase